MGKGWKHKVQADVYQVGTLTWACKVWVHQLERSPHGHIMLEMAYLNLLLHAGIHDQWFQRGSPFWKDICRLWDLGDGEGHYQRGTKGTKMVTIKKQGRAATGVELAEVTPETCCSVEGAQVCILHSAAPANPKEKTPEQLASFLEANPHTRHKHDLTAQLREQRFEDIFAMMAK